MRRLGAACALAGRAAPGHLGGYLLLTTVVGALPVVTAWLTKALVDRLAAGEARGTLPVLAAGLAVAGIVATVTPQLTQYLRAELGRAVGLLAQDRLFTATERFTGLGRFEDPRFLDRLRLAQQSGHSAPTQVVDGVVGLTRAAVTIGGFLGSLLVVNGWLAALVLVSGVPTLVAEIALSRGRARMFWAIGPAERREVFYSHLLCGVEAAKEIRLFGTGGFLRARMLGERRAADAAKRAVDRRQVRVQSGLGLLAAGVSGAALIWAIGAAASGRITAGDVIVLAAAVVGVQTALTSLAAEVARSHEALLLFGHYATVTALGPDLPRSSPPAPLPPLRDAIELRDVWFRYSPDHPWVLRGVSLRIPYGHSLALVGLNGSGKSTLVKLLCRFYDPTHGRILWDGTDIRTVDPAELRRSIGAVFQDFMQYHLTAAENIGLGDLDALGDRERVVRSARRAGVHDTLAALPHGYDTLLSRVFFAETDRDDPSSGVALSGGQAQRVAIARAFLRDRRELMILDEPSAGLDPEAEHEIHASLRRHRQGRTSLLITHRLGAVRDADHIVVLRDGRVAEEGDHDTLAAAGGFYARLFGVQAEGYHPSATAGSRGAGR
ncbi:ABC transporter ATP-binding protein [Streptomyces sp. TRM64462]|uniref:ABC transporter ATP-binding protein n=1 Tax=Streptomyces sp. TRM64462 TaxID=2741726 RepID=UPI00281566E4|nr:ABC transporter ATP-binding protein [Streptomyces sp. TRM64462]